MTSSPTREEVEAVLVALDEATKEGAGPLAQRCEDMLRALHARAEAAERERDNWKRRAEDMHRRVTAAEGCAYNRWMRDQRDAARAEAARLREEGRREEREACAALLESMRAAHNTAMIGVWHTPDTTIAYGKAAAAIRARSKGKS